MPTQTRDSKYGCIYCWVSSVLKGREYFLVGECSGDTHNFYHHWWLGDSSFFGDESWNSVSDSDVFITDIFQEALQGEL